MAGLTNVLYFIGVVENNFDERLEGRVQVRAFGFHGTIDQVPTRDLPWAIPIATGYDVNYPIPPLNSWVFGIFLDGQDAQQPFILGILPTQFIEPINPELNGWGVVDSEDFHIRAKGFRPQDLGQPQNSRLARGENIEQTYNVDLETTRVRGVSSASGGTWDEPNSAYAAQYPYNRVIETAGGHSIELDDTPGAERIMIYHNSGSYVQVDPRGTTTNKATGDKYDVNENNMHVYVGGRSDVTVLGDCYLKVEGSRLEEIMGNSKTVVHGNYELDVGGFANFNASDEVQMRAARVAIESKVENLDLLAAKKLNMTGSEIATVSSPNLVSVQSEGQLSVKAPDVFVQGEGTLNLKANQVKVGGGDKVSLSASLVAIDDFINLSSGNSDAPDDAFDGFIAQGTQMTEPTSKSVVGAIGSSGGMSNYYAGTVGPMATDSPIDLEQSAIISTCSTDLIDALKQHERFSPNAYWDNKQYSIGYGIKTDDPNEVIDEAEASSRLAARVSTDRNYVRSFGISNGYNWNDCQIDALTSFVYNLGRGALETATASGSRSNEEIAAAMLQYNGVLKNGVKTVLPGLVSRRQSESSWFRNGSGEDISEPDQTEGLIV